MAARLDVVAIGIEHERAVVVLVIVRAQPRWPVVASSGCQRSLVEAIHGVAVLGRKGDMAMGISTSGKSANVNRALQAAKQMGMLTIGFAGRDGGRMPGLCDHCFVMPSFSIHRIQEAQERDRLLNEVWGYNYFGTTRTLDQVIVQLRKKLGDSAEQPKHLLTVHGVGYKLKD